MGGFMSRGIRSIMVMLLLLLVAGPAAAHKVRVFATVEGTTIQGYAYFGGADRAQGVKVEMFAPDGTRLGETLTDKEGVFSFAATQRVDHRIVVNAGQGHVAEFTVLSSELPNSLGAGGKEIGRDELSHPAPEAAGTLSTAGGELSAVALQALLDKAVARQIRPLREQLDAYGEKVRWHDVLGGIGYIFGVAGVAFYLLGQRRSS